MGAGKVQTGSAALAEPAPELLDFVRRHIRNCRVDRRSDGGTLHLVKALVQTIDEHCRPIGEPFAAVTRDVSPTEVSLIHEQAIRGRLLAVRMRIEGNETHFVCEVNACRQLGPYHLLEGKLVARLNGFPQAEEAVWLLCGRIEAAGVVCETTVAESPFTIGRRSDVSLHLPSPAVSGLHAEIIEREGLLRLRDLKSTNGSFVNGELVRGERALDEDDLVQFGDVTLRVGRRSVGRSDVAVVESVWDEELARARFDELFDKRAVACDFQPIVELANLKPAAFQALPRSRLFGLSKPSELFETAAHFDHEAELYELLRYEAVAAGRELPGRPELFVSMHRRELDLPEQLAASLELLRREFPEPPLALEVHEAEVTDAEAVLRLRAALGDLGVRLVYGGFGANCSRLVELAQMPPDVLAFDMAFIRCIHAAGEKRQKMLTALVRTARELGITTLATGVEIEPESETCRQLGFDLAQGHLFGKPAGPASWDTEQAVR